MFPCASLPLGPAFETCDDVLHHTFALRRLMAVSFVFCENNSTVLVTISVQKETEPSSHASKYFPLCAKKGAAAF